MVPVSIEDALKRKCPDLKLGCIQCHVIVDIASPELTDLIGKTTQSIRNDLTIQNIGKLPPILAAREGYKQAGKDPLRYRLSADSLLRRILKNNDLYKINNVVDVLNLVSIKTGFSIGGYDVSKIESPAIFGIGAENEPYIGIGRGKLNIQHMPVLRDSSGAFGCPTSDSIKTMVSETTTTFLMVFFSFGGTSGLQTAMDLAIDVLVRFATASKIEQQVI